MKHGTDSTYCRHGCRCADCRRAHADYQWFSNRRRARALATSGVPHGRASTYGNHRCRCDECTEAWRAYIADYRARRKAKKERAA